MLKIRTKTERGEGGGGCGRSNTNNDSLGKKAQIKPTNPTADSTRAKAKKYFILIPFKGKRACYT